MTEAEIQAQIHYLLEGDTTTPGSTDDEYTFRRALINRGIKTWEKEPNTQWQELWGKLVDASDGDTTTVADQANYTTPTNFRYPLSYLKIDGTSSTFYPFYTPQAYNLIDSADTTTKFYYVMGDIGGGYTIYIHPAPSATGSTITYDYYKVATEMSATTDEPQLSDPLFLVDYSLYDLRRRAGDIGGAREAMMSATTRMEDMKDRNAMVPWNQSNSIRDIDWVRGVRGFGK